MTGGDLRTTSQTEANSCATLRPQGGKIGHQINGASFRHFHFFTDGLYSDCSISPVNFLPFLLFLPLTFVPPRASRLVARAFKNRNTDVILYGQTAIN